MESFEIRWRNSVRKISCNSPTYLRFGRDVWRAVSTAVMRNTSIETRTSPFFQTWAILPLGETVRKSGCGTGTFSPLASTMLNGTNGAACQNTLSSVAVIA